MFKNCAEFQREFFRKNGKREKQEYAMEVKQSVLVKNTGVK